jgi:hypothetical protein
VAATETETVAKTRSIERRAVGGAWLVLAYVFFEPLIANTLGFLYPIVVSSLVEDVEDAIETACTCMAYNSLLPVVLSPLLLPGVWKLLTGWYGVARIHPMLRWGTLVLAPTFVVATALYAVAKIADLAWLGPAQMTAHLIGALLVFFGLLVAGDFLRIVGRTGRAQATMVVAVVVLVFDLGSGYLMRIQTEEFTIGGFLVSGHYFWPVFSCFVAGCLWMMMVWLLWCVIGAVQALAQLTVDDGRPGP